MSEKTMSFNEIKDFGYLLQHPNAAELVSKIIKLSVFVKGKDYGDSVPQDFFATADLKICKVSFDRNSAITQYRVHADNLQKDFNDFAEVVAFILGRWY